MEGGLTAAPAPASTVPMIGPTRDVPNVQQIKDMMAITTLMMKTIEYGI